MRWLGEQFTVFPLVLEARNRSGLRSDRRSKHRPFNLVTLNNILLNGVISNCGKEPVPPLRFAGISHCLEINVARLDFGMTLRIPRNLSFTTNRTTFQHPTKCPCERIKLKYSVWRAYVRCYMEQEFDAAVNAAFKWHMSIVRRFLILFDGDYIGMNFFFFFLPVCRK